MGKTENIRIGFALEDTIIFNNLHPAHLLCCLYCPSESSRCASIKEGVTSSFISSRREVLKKSNPFLHNFIFLFMEHFYKHINTFYFPPLKNPLLTHKICYYVLKSLLSSFLSLFSAAGTLSLLWLLKYSRHMPMC